METVVILAIALSVLCLLVFCVVGALALIIILAETLQKSPVWNMFLAILLGFAICGFYLVFKY